MELVFVELVEEVVSEAAVPKLRQDERGELAAPRRSVSSESEDTLIFEL